MEKGQFSGKKVGQNRVEFLTFDTASLLVNSLVKRIRYDLNEAIESRKNASLMVSGGTTPMALFEALSQADLAWQRVVIGLVDERWVHPSDDESNEKLVRSCLLKNKAGEARFIGMKIEAQTPVSAEEVCDRRYRQIPSPFDLVLLGLGIDGHTASLFPDASRLGAAVDRSAQKMCLGLESPYPPRDRLTLTLPALLGSRRIILHIEGEAKKETYARALRKGPRAQMPIRYFLRQNDVPVTVYWAP